MKFVLVTGGVMSGLGKGVVASSTGVILKAMGVRVTSIKVDPYLNVDAGTMSPFEHGEVFVLDDGGEADLDLGNYERFLDVTLTRDNNITTGKVYRSVIERERRGDYLGKTVQTVPHVTGAIEELIVNVAHTPVDGTQQLPEVCIIELGGTVGDMEHAPFIEAMRQLRWQQGANNFCCVHVSLVPQVGSSKEQKTKPTQNGVRDLRARGLTPDVIVCRSSTPLTDATKRKIADFAQLAPTAVVGCHDVSNLWRVPLLMVAQGVPDLLTRHFNLNPPLRSPNLDGWRRQVADRWDRVYDRTREDHREVRIALVGKYTELSDAYHSVIKSLQHASLAAECAVDIVWIESDKLVDAEADVWGKVKSCHGMLVPGGFGDRGVEGKLEACRYAREHKMPFLGICLGMQCAVIEFARNVAGWPKAHSAEFDSNTPDPVVIYMPEISTQQMGGTMRLGRRQTVLTTEQCISYELYGSTQIEERHRHRYEVNPERVAELEKAGLRFVGHDATLKRMEIIELPREEHPFFVGCQYHPEFLTRPTRPSPLFLGLVRAAGEEAVDLV